MEPTSALFLTLGCALLALSWILLLITAAREDFTWGLCTVLLPPLSYLYGLWRWELCRDPILLAVAGWVLVWLGCVT